MTAPLAIRTSRHRPVAASLLVSFVATTLLACAGATATVAARAAAGPCSFGVDLTATPTAGSIPLLVQFGATVSGGTPTEYDWTFGDGGFWVSSAPGANAPFHRYDAVGLFDAGVAVTEAGCSATASVSVAAVAGPLSVVVTAAPVGGGAPLTVDFSASATGGSGTYATAVWSFGDGGVGSGFAVNYTYRDPGSYVAVLNVTDSDGHWSVATTSISVRGATDAPAGSLLGAPAIAWELGGVSVLLAIAALVATRRLWFGRPALADAPRPPPSEPSPEVKPAADPSPELVARRDITAASGTAGGDDVPSGVDRPGALAARSPTEVAATTASDLERLRLTERVLLHIGRQGVLGRDEVAPFGLSQLGMAASLGVRQNSLTNVVRRLTAAGILTQELRHVADHPRRLRVYQLTRRGEALYRDLRQRAVRSVPSTSGFDRNDPDPDG